MSNSIIINNNKINEIFNLNNNNIFNLQQDDYKQLLEYFISQGYNENDISMLITDNNGNVIIEQIQKLINSIN